jgi:CO/xanthine dehydrogenase Mo-binding subunit
MVVLLASPIGAVAGTVSDTAARAIPGVKTVVRVPTGIAVVADKTWTAMRARDALVIEWIDKPAAHLNSDAYRALLDPALDHGKTSRREGPNVDSALEAVEVSRAARMPVQAVWTREDDMRHDRYHPAAVNRITAGLDASGKSRRVGTLGAAQRQHHIRARTNAAGQFQRFSRTTDARDAGRGSPRCGERTSAIRRR